MGLKAIFSEAWHAWCASPIHRNTWQSATFGVVLALGIAAVFLL